MHNLNKKYTLKEIFTDAKGGMYEEGGRVDRNNKELKDCDKVQLLTNLYYLTESADKHLGAVFDQETKNNIFSEFASTGTIWEYDEFLDMFYGPEDRLSSLNSKWIMKI